MSCFGKAGNPKKLESWWKRVESGAFKIDPTGSPQAQIISFGLNAPRFTRLLPSGIALGRELHPAQDRWSVASYKFSREGDIYKWQEIGRVIDTASNSPSGMFYSAYDPSVTYFQGKHYLPFECAGAGVGPTAGVCMSEIDINGKPTTSVVVQVLSVTDGADRLSASVPKLFVHRGSLYLAWTQVRLNATTNAFRAITVRAAKLADATQEFNIGTAPRLLSNQGFLLMAKADGMADVMDIVSTGQWIYVIFAQEPPGCLTPLDLVPGCYDLHVSRTKNLDASSNADLLNSAHVLAPNYPQEYGFFIFCCDSCNIICRTCHFEYFF